MNRERCHDKSRNLEDKVPSVQSSSIYTIHFGSNVWDYHLTRWNGQCEDNKGVTLFGRHVRVVSIKTICEVCTQSLNKLITLSSDEFIDV